MSGQYPNTFYRVAVKALIKNDKGEVLLVKEKSNTWDLPGGGLDHGEEPEDGLKRELLEEIGVTDATISKPILVKSFWLEDKQAWLMWIVYEINLTDTQFKHGEGVTDIAWVKPTDLAQSNDERERFISTLIQ